MHLKKLTPAHVQAAVRLYLALAYPPDHPRAEDPLDYGAGATAEELLEQFLDETRPGPGERLRRYALRLGNVRYPFMKFVLQEFVQPGDFYFAVDTHDDLKLSPEVPGYEEFQAVRAFNRELKQRIERAWREQGLPTLVGLASDLRAAGGPGGGRRERLLVVDDEPELAGVMAALLRRHGYRVDVAFTGRQALAQAARHEYALIICDYQLPDLDGAAVCEALRAAAATRAVPVLLMTAAPVRLETITDKASGFLVKPYREEILLGLIQGLLEPEGGGER